MLATSKMLSDDTKPVESLTLTWGLDTVNVAFLQADVYVFHRLSTKFLSAAAGQGRFHCGPGLGYSFG